MLIEKLLADNNIEVESYNGFLLREPSEILKPDGNSYKVFTPYSPYAK